MRVVWALVTTLAVLSSTPARVLAQSTSRRGAYDIRDRIKAGWAKKRGENTPAPTGTNANAAAYFIPQGKVPGAPTNPATARTVYPKFQPNQPGPGAPGAAPAPATAPVATTPPRPPPRPRVPIVPGLRAPGVRKLETEEDLEEYQEVARVRKAARVRMAVTRAAREDQEMTEFSLVQRVLGALEMPAPEDAEGLRRAGLQVRPNRLEAGDLLFFQIPHGGKISEHVAVFFGEDRFAYVGPRGVSLAPLDDTWRGRLLMVRRPR